MVENGPAEGGGGLVCNYCREFRSARSIIQIDTIRALLMIAYNTLDSHDPASWSTALLLAKHVVAAIDIATGDYQLEGCAHV
jgi:hypothetical protein